MSKLKKFVRSAALAIALTAAMSTCAMALTSDQTYNRDIEVRVEDADGLSESEISRVKNGVIAVYLSGKVASDDISTYNLTCTLFGHDKQTRNASLIEHQVNKKAPRCKQVYYKGYNLLKVRLYGHGDHILELYLLLRRGLICRLQSEPYDGLPPFYGTKKTPDDIFVSVIGSFYLCVVSCRYNCLRIRAQVTWPLR